jgi:1,4-alpha-glucan branching enzyme
VVNEPGFDWERDDFRIGPRYELVIYELHIGTFHDLDQTDDRPGTFETASEQLGTLKKLGVDAIEIMPVTEFPARGSRDYDPCKSSPSSRPTGVPRHSRRSSKECHRQGFAVILDVIYNHFGPHDLDLWRFDGWYENNLWGFFLYVWRAEPLRGYSRPDYGRVEVRPSLRDNPLMWLEDHQVDPSHRVRRSQVRRSVGWPIRPEDLGGRDHSDRRAALDAGHPQCRRHQVQ